MFIYSFNFSRGINNIQKHFWGTPGWLSQEDWLLILPQVIISGFWDWAWCWAPRWTLCWAWSCLKFSLPFCLSPNSSTHTCTLTCSLSLSKKPKKKNPTKKQKKISGPSLRNSIPYQGHNLYYRGQNCSIERDILVKAVLTHSEWISSYLLHHAQLNKHTCVF